MLKKLLIILLFIAPNASNADERKPGAYFTIGAGAANLKIDSDFSVDGESDDDSIAGLHLGLGYLSNVGLLLEYTGTGYSNVLDIFAGDDGYDLSQNKILLGYAFTLENGDTRIIPKVGYSDWTLGGYEGSGFFPVISIDPVDDIDGDDVFYELGIFKDISEEASLSLNFQYMDADFGSYSNVYASLEFAFWDALFK